ncbi:M13 family metallopeptidase [Periweissella ghanensis]|uniref:Neutral endopeptidase n=1 Tax=Periweissella ghanensis TaxID=467997 RepID=A0ABM8ZDZ7_9LACO|nr:M13-type metalloendopeptidase [Periweissella ghanensis]MCM0601342.1 M13 family peptidase [Periweissella ghanensis]CAH0419409.1 Neutral endopeptidase [Periweissella ghanensis]
MVKIQDDLYKHVNADWLANTEIPADRPRIGAFDEIDIKIEQQELADFAAMRKDNSATGMLGEFIKYYRLTSDWATRNAQGAEPAKVILEKYEKLNSLADLQAHLVELKLAGLPTAILPVYVDQDMKDTSRNILQADAMGTLLPDTTYYEEGGDSAELFQLLENSYVPLLEKYGYATEEAHRIVQQAIEFDKLVAQYVLSNEAKSDYWKLYNPQDFVEFTQQARHIDIAKLVPELIDATPTMINVTDVRFWQNYDKIVNEDNFAGIKAMLILGVVSDLASYLSDDIRIANGVFSRALSGTAEARSAEKAAFNLAHAAFSPVVGDYYGRKYFGEAAKADVLDMVKKMIGVYQERLESNTWLGEETKQKAILKLSTIGLNVGYPDVIPARYTLFVVDEQAGLLANALRFRAIQVAHSFSQFKLSPDKTEWEMPADMVNAYYHPFHNIIVFPAAILQAPFYSLEQSKSANYGGIGAVIAHEISHAFDTNGARFDEKGNLNSWWTDADFKAFEERTDAMVKEFDGLDSAGATVNGKLVVSENVADVGGMSVALEAAKSEDEVSLTDFFTNWATVWRMNASKEYMKLLSKVDVHAPARLRANVQVTNFADFFTTFDVTPTDKMWRAPEDRVQIW